MFRELLPAVRRLDGLMDLCQSTGWFWPFQGVVIFTRRPVEVHLLEGRLHKDGGMAVRYRDGFGVYALHGVRVPQWLAESRMLISTPGVCWS